VIHGDYSAKLTCLLHYPPLPGTSQEGDDVNEGKDDGLLPHHITLLLRQALAFQMAPTPSTGGSIVSENKNMLGIPVEMATSASTPGAGAIRQPPAHHYNQQQQQQRPDPVRRPHLGTLGPASEGRGLDSPAGGSSSSGLSHARNQSAASIPEMLARGLLDKGESLGINKTVMSAYSEFKVP
jgi:TBC1 domain family member 5